MKFDNIRVSHKLWFTVLGLLCLLLASILFLQKRSNAMIAKSFDDIAYYEANITQATRWLGLTEVVVERTAALISVQDPEASKVLQERTKENSATITTIQTAIRDRSTSAVEKAAIELVGRNRTAALSVLKKVPEVKATGSASDALEFVLKEFLPAANTLTESIRAYVQLQEKQRDAVVEATQQSRQRALFLGWAFAAVILTAATILTAALVRSIDRPLRRAVEVANAISAGDLTQTLETEREDEFGELLRAFSQMSERLRLLVSEVRTGVDAVSTASSDIARGNQDLSTRTEHTAASLEQTTSRMEQITTTVSQSADTARHANQLAGQAAQSAARGGEVVGQVVSTMQQISESSRKISDIIGVIDGIAFQTNILALNAAVEAARAGEQGRGFAVVASEVRSLAGRSAEAAKEIKALIGTSVSNVESGSQQVAQAGQSMAEIVSGVRQVSDLINEITAAATEQRDGITQVGQAITNIDQMTLENVALVEESAAAANAMHAQAMRLAEIVAVFKLGQQGATYHANTTLALR